MIYCLSHFLGDFTRAPSDGLFWNINCCGVLCSIYRLSSTISLQLWGETRKDCVWIGYPRRIRTQRLYGLSNINNYNSNRHYCFDYLLGWLWKTTEANIVHEASYLCCTATSVHQFNMHVTLKFSGLPVQFRQCRLSGTWRESCRAV
jgi:hypothetical protein